MTLRDIGHAIADGVETAVYSVQHLSPLDWPLWLVGLAIICSLPFLGFSLHVAAGCLRLVGRGFIGILNLLFEILAAVFGLLWMPVRKAGRAYRARDERRIRSRAGIPEDMRERLLWANRQGPYAGR